VRRKLASDVEARRIIRSAMERHGMSYKRLATALTPRAHLLGMRRVTERNLVSRISRGTFSFGFAIEVLRAMGVREIDIAPIRTPGAKEVDRYPGPRR